MSRKDESPLTTERVQISRRGPLLVALAAISVVGLLVWKPWEPPVAAPTLSPVAVLPTTNPTLAPSFDPVPIDIASIVNLGSTSVRCEYIPSAGGEWLLASLLVVPPRLEPGPDIADANVFEVSWRAEVQRNELASIFSANWEEVALSDRQVSPAITSPFVAFQPLHLAYEEATPTPSVLRVVIIVEWFGPGRASLGSARFVVTTYDPGKSRPARSEGCHTITVG